MTTSYEPQREPDDNGGVIYKIGRGAKWVVPLTAISAAAVSIARLSVTPPGWLQKAAETAGDVAPLDADPIVCLTLSAVTLAYWLSRDGWESLLRLFAMFKYATADRKERERIARRAHARGRDEGLSEGRMEGLSEGRKEGLSEGRKEGLSEGRKEGLSEGRIEGLNEGRIEGHGEAQARIQAWWEQATNGGTQPPSLDNPPPIINTDDTDADGSAA